MKHGIFLLFCPLFYCFLFYLKESAGKDFIGAAVKLCCCCWMQMFVCFFGFFCLFAWFLKNGLSSPIFHTKNLSRNRNDDDTENEVETCWFVMKNRPNYKSFFKRKEQGNPEDCFGSLWPHSLQRSSSGGLRSFFFFFVHWKTFGCSLGCRVGGIEPAPGGGRWTPPWLADAPPGFCNSSSTAAAGGGERLPTSCWQRRRAYLASASSKALAARMCFVGKLAHPDNKNGTKPPSPEMIS